MNNLIHLEEGKVDCSPRDVLYDENKIDMLVKHYCKLIEDQQILNAGFLVARKGRICAHKTLGLRTYEGFPGDFYLPHHKKWIASISKIYTAIAIMQLVEKGLIYLDQPLYSVLGEFDNSTHRNISILHLLTHTSGLPADAGYFLEPYPHNLLDLAQNHAGGLLNAIVGPLQGVPGKQWNYCSLGFYILAELITRVSGVHFDDYVRQNILLPCGLTQTFVGAPPEMENEFVFASEDCKVRFNSQVNRSRALAPDGSGGIYSSMLDLFKIACCFEQAGEINGVQLLSKCSVRLMKKNCIEAVPAFYWGREKQTMRQGIGWEFLPETSILSNSSYCHEGYGWSSLIVDPENEFILVRFAASSTSWNHKIMISPRDIACSGIL